MASQVQLIFLYHPLADTQSSPLPDAIMKRLENLYQGGASSIQIAHIRYGQLPSTAHKKKSEPGADLERFLSSSSKLALTPFTSNTIYWQQREALTLDAPPSILLNVVKEIQKPRSVHMQEVLDSLMQVEGLSDGEDNSAPQLGCLADGLVAAIELFCRTTPYTTAPLARYLVHLLPDTPPLDLNDTSFPHSNLDSNHDQWGWLKAAQELGKMCVWPSTHVLPSLPATSSASLTPECEKVHKCILDELPSMYPSITDVPSILGGTYKKQSNAQGLLLSGFSDASATAAKVSAGASAGFGRKRGRKASVNVKSVKDRAREEGGSKGPVSELVSIAPLGSSVTGTARSEIDKTSVNKVLFLQQQQQMMMRNLAIAARQQQSKGPDQDSPARHRLLEQFLDQLLAQQTTLKAQAAILSSGGSVPNLSNSLTSLIAIDKDASEKGLHLGGPSGMQQTMMERQKQLMHQQQMQQQQQQQRSTTTLDIDARNNTAAAAVSREAAAAALASTAGAPNAQQRKSGSVQPFWNGAIMWSVALPNNTRNQAATFVAAHCAPNTSKETLMLPWPQRLSISEIQAISIAALQAYAAKNSTSCILFQPIHIPNQRPQGNGAGPQQTNETMYLMLARMIDSKKSCAFISLQGENCTPDAGIVIVPTPTQAGASSRRLLGLIFRQAVPWHLFGGTGQQPQQGLALPPQQQQQQQQQQAQQPTQQQVQQQQQLQQQQPLNAPQFASPVNVGMIQPQSALPPSSSVGAPQQAVFQSQPQMNQMPNQFTGAAVSNVQQLPSWPRPVAPASYAPSSQGVNTAIAPAFPQPAPPTSAAPADVLASSGIDFSMLANQFNFNGQQPQSQLHLQQQQQQPSFNANMFNNNIWSASAAGNNQGGIPPQQNGSGSVPSQPPSVDLEALQRLLGLGSS